MSSPFWLTRITPRLDRADVLRDLADAGGLHRRVMSLFPDDLGEQPRRSGGVLFRVESAGAGMRVLIQSSQRPDVSALPDGYGDVGVIGMKGLLDSLTNGMRVRYRLTANPSKQYARGHTGPGRPGQRVALHGEQAEEWWLSRAGKAGLALETMVMIPRPDATDSGHRIKGRGMRHAVAQFDGTATVVDAATLQDAIVNGVGRGKAFGCGMLSILPLRTETGISQEQAKAG